MLLFILTSYKCDSQCALEMRCPPGLIFDDPYQRCEWPGAGLQRSSRRLSSLRGQQYEHGRNGSGNDTQKIQPLRLMTTMKRATSTVSAGKKRN